ncbi:hypothetical protein C5167_002673 [Papaver somniferum]|uniref:Uncharacterized protein n=1 Tax=Papaver somniferum TaxID=3469 RepID=A0A4Y7L0E2_PAPSO|nr:hypothetical protein C5167_002673 [Papaver somniferum]
MEEKKTVESIKMPEYSFQPYMSNSGLNVIGLSFALYGNRCWVVNYTGVVPKNLIWKFEPLFHEGYNYFLKRLNICLYETQFAPVTG